MVEGLRAVKTAISACPSVHTVTGEADVLEQMPKGIMQRLKKQNASVLTATSRDIEALSDVKSDQGIIAWLRWEHNTLPKKPEPGLWLAFDGLTNPGNLGTLIRTAVWFGVRGVLAAKETAELLSPKIMRACAGEVFKIPMCENIDLPETLTQWKADGWEVVAATPQGDVPLAKLPAHKKRVLVLGSEAHGLSDEVERCITNSVNIPGGGGESLNVAVAGAICCWELSGRGAGA